MIQAGIIFVLSALFIAAAGFAVSTAGLGISFARVKFSRLVYLGLGLVALSATIMALVFGVSGIKALQVVNSLGEGLPPAAAPVLDEPDVMEEDPIDVGVEEDGPFPEMFIPSIYSSTGGSLECTSSEVADNFMIDFFIQPQITQSGSTYVVADSESTGYIITDTLNGPTIVYVDTYSYQISAVNDVAYDSTYLLYPEDEGFEAIDTDSEAYQVAEGCVS